MKAKFSTPTWHKGPWTARKEQALIAKLTQAQTQRSLTREERQWLDMTTELTKLHDLFGLK